MARNMFPSVTGSTRFKNDQPNFPYNPDVELETQRSRLANLKMQPSNVKRRRPSSQKPTVGQARKPSKVILEPIKSQTPNELDQRLMNDSLRKATLQRQISTISTQTINLDKEKETSGSNDWRKGFQTDMENLFEKERKKGIVGWLPQRSRSVSLVNASNLRPPNLGSITRATATPQKQNSSVLLPQRLLGRTDSNMLPLTSISIKKSLSDSRITTPRLNVLTPMTNRSMSIASLAIGPSIPQSPSPSTMSTLPVIGGYTSRSFLTYNSEISDRANIEGPATPPIIAAPSAKLSFSEINPTSLTNSTAPTARDSPEIRPIGSAKLRQVQQAAALLNSSDEEQQIKGTSIMHKHLLFETNPPIDSYLELGVIEPLAKCLLSNNESLVLGSLLALSGVVSGTQNQTVKVVDAKVLSDLVRLLSSDNDEIVTQSINCLGNIAGGSEDFKEDLLEEGVIKSLTDLVAKSPGVERSQKLAWVLSNLSQPSYLPVADDDMNRIFQSLLTLLKIKDENTVQTATWVLSYISERAGQISTVIERGFLPLMFDKIHEFSDNPSMLFPLLRVLGNIATGDNEETQAVIDQGLIPFLVSHCSHYIMKIRKECLWIISNITAGNEQQIQATIDFGVFPALASIIQKENEFEILKEAGWGIANVFSGGSVAQIDEAVKNDFPKCLSKILFRFVFGQPDDYQIPNLCLEALNECLSSCSSFPKFYKSTFEHSSIEEFQYLDGHISEDIRTLASKFLEKVKELYEDNSEAVTKEMSKPLLNGVLEKKIDEEDEKKEDIVIKEDNVGENLTQIVTEMVRKDNVKDNNDSGNEKKEKGKKISSEKKVIKKGQKKSTKNIKIVPKPPKDDINIDKLIKKL